MTVVISSRSDAVVVQHESSVVVTRQGRETVVVRQPKATSAFVVRGVPGLRGPQGERGDDGAPGAGLLILGALASPAELPGAAQAGDAYLIEGDLWVHDGTAWANGGPIQGPAGKDGQIRFTGHGAPPVVIVGAQPGDTYLDLDSGDVYKLQ